ncbi:MAG: 23S rRNA (guanosine(2251)-2'-O)-methyltransferase RlmB [Thermoanaerobaculia bacterium]
MTGLRKIFGFHPVHEALRHRPGDVVRVWAAEGKAGRRFQTVERLCRSQGVELERVPAADLDRLAPGVHNGFVAELREAERKPAGDGDPTLVVLLEDVQDPRNLGAILRACDGAGVGRVLVRDRGSAPVSPAAVKASAGAAEWVPVERVTNSAIALERLKADGYWIYGADAGGAPAWTVDLTGKIVLCLGGEESGLRARTRGLCDGLIALPMQGRIDSLNVSAAAAALLFEAVRQRLGSTSGR